MEKEFIPYVHALALKELGFREHCAAFYSTEEELCFKWESNGNMSLHLLRLIQAPTFSQAFRWFREKYGICVWITSKTVDSKTSYIIHGRTIPDTIKNNLIVDIIPYVTTKTYEEAEIGCLKKLIEIVKK
jgi:predicted GNAT superfamily acetyltransferase